jgi:hypothetical protein
MSFRGADFSKAGKERISKITRSKGKDSKSWNQIHKDLQILVSTLRDWADQPISQIDQTKRTSRNNYS